MRVANIDTKVDMKFYKLNSPVKYLKFHLMKVIFNRIPFYVSSFLHSFGHGGDTNPFRAPPIFPWAGMRLFYSLTQIIKFDFCICTMKIGNIRLVGGTGKHEGRIEVKWGKWGTICDDHFDIKDGHVACKQMGFNGAKSIKQFGPGSGSIHLDDLECTGNEKDLFNCPHSGIGAHNCGHSEDVGVVCISKCQQIISFCQIS